MNTLTLIEKAFFLKRSLLFSELDLDLVLAIADKADERHFKTKETIFCLNQDAHRLYVIVEGGVTIYNEEQTPLTSLIPPDFFGDESLFNQEARGYSVEANKETILLTISRTHLIEIMLECPQVAICLIRDYAAVTTFRKRKEELCRE